MKRIASHSQSDPPLPSKREIRPITRLYLVIGLILLTGFLSLYCLLFQRYLLALGMIVCCWLIDQKMFVCPFCGAKLKAHTRLNPNTVCGKCCHNLYTGEAVKIQNGRMRVKKQDVGRYQ